MKGYYLTTPIYYVNDVPHIGHAYTTVAADVLARWHRLKGRDVFFLTGTDEHGAKIAQAAARAGQSPKEFTDAVSAAFRTAWRELGITNDHFVRTTDPEHEKTVQFFLEKLNSAGAVYKSRYEGLYCVQCEKFLSPGDLNEDLCCPDHRVKPVTHAEENYFFRLSGYRERLIQVLSDGTMEVRPSERRNEILGKLKAGPLEDISISRAAVEWGVPLPFDKSQTAYVWIDALLNYISAIGYRQNTETFKKFWPADLHLMAKDILWFHGVIWPAMLMAVGLPVPKRMFAHGFFTINGEKMSKTIGNVIRPRDLVERYGVDASRYLLLSLFPFGTDGDISWAALTEKYNTDLANNLGNLVARTLTMVEKFSGGVIPAPAGGAARIDAALAAQMAEAEPLLENLDFYRFAGAIQNALDQANRYIENTAPWKMAKEKDPGLPTVLFTLVSNVRIIARYLVPVMPDISRKIWEQIGETEPVEKAAGYFFRNPRDPGAPRPGNTVRKGPALFPRIEARKSS